MEQEEPALPHPRGALDGAPSSAPRGCGDLSGDEKDGPAQVQWVGPADDVSFEAFARHEQEREHRERWMQERRQKIRPDRDHGGTDHTRRRGIGEKTSVERSAAHDTSGSENFSGSEWSWSGARGSAERGSSGDRTSGGASSHSSGFRFERQRRQAEQTAHTAGEYWQYAARSLNVCGPDKHVMYWCGTANSWGGQGVC